MKRLILAAIFGALAYSSFAQKHELLMGDHILSHAQTMNYDSLVLTAYGSDQTLCIGGVNKYVVDNDNKELSLFFEDRFQGKTNLLSYEETDSYIKYSYTDREIKLDIDFVTYAIYYKDKKEGDPQLLIYYLNPADNLTTICYRSIE